MSHRCLIVFFFKRLDALESFRDGKVDFLLATDLAARGLDILGIETVSSQLLPSKVSQSAAIMLLLIDCQREREREMRFDIHLP